MEKCLETSIFLCLHLYNVQQSMKMGMFSCISSLCASFCPALCHYGKRCTVHVGARRASLDKCCMAGMCMGIGSL